MGSDTKCERETPFFPTELFNEIIFMVDNGQSLATKRELRLFKKLLTIISTWGILSFHF